MSPRAKRQPAARWHLRIYVAGQTSKSVAAIAALHRLCEERLKGRYTIEVIDLIESPHRARKDNIVALPTVVRSLPLPIRRLIGSLSDTARALVGLELEERP